MTTRNKRAMQLHLGSQHRRPRQDKDKDPGRRHPRANAGSAAGANSGGVGAKVKGTGAGQHAGSWLLKETPPGDRITLALHQQEGTKVEAGDKRTRQSSGGETMVAERERGQDSGRFKAAQKARVHAAGGDGKGGEKGGFADH